MAERQILADILQSKRSIILSFLFGSQAKGYANQRSDRDTVLNTLLPPVLGFQIINEGQILTDKQEDGRLEVTAAILLLSDKYIFKLRDDKPNIAGQI